MHDHALSYFCARPNVGGGTEVVIPEGGAMMQSFSTI